MLVDIQSNFIVVEMASLFGRFYSRQLSGSSRHPDDNNHTSDSSPRQESHEAPASSFPDDRLKSNKYEMTGYMRKRNTKAKSKLLKKWDKRWFAVDSHSLMYAASPDKCEARKSFPITDILEVRVVDDPENKVEQFEFELTLPGRILRLRPKSDSQRRHWVAAIQRVRALAVGQVTDGKPDSHTVSGYKRLVKKSIPGVRDFEQECARRFSGEDRDSNLRSSTSSSAGAIQSGGLRESTGSLRESSGSLRAHHAAQRPSKATYTFDDDDDNTDKRKALAGPRTPSPTYNRSPKQPKIVASKMHSNSLFGNEEEGDEDYNSTSWIAVAPWLQPGMNNDGRASGRQTHHQRQAV